MRVYVPRDMTPSETRVPVVPATVKSLVGLGAGVEIESGLGAAIRIGDRDFEDAGAKISRDAEESLAAADIVLRLNRPPIEEVQSLRPGTLLIGLLQPFADPELIDEIARRGVTALSLEMLPRTTLAQKMDALSSQANLAGYAAVVLAAERSERIFPMMMTPAGTISPARVLVIGAGVAGLQAIATARRLGARVEAYDIRPAVEEQIKSLGARFLKVDVGESGETEHGYSLGLEERQLMKQRELLMRHCAQTDVIVSSAQVFGRKAPVIITREMIAGMKPGSVIVDMAVETGGNVEGSRRGEEVEIEGVLVAGYPELSRRVPVNASEMYSSNLGNLMEHFWDREARRFNLDLEDEILKSSVITHDNRITNQAIADRLGVKA